jgi:hypothetical protein
VSFDKCFANPEGNAVGENTRVGFITPKGQTYNFSAFPSFVNLSDSLW